jgi:hypothetical protein
LSRQDRKTLKSFFRNGALPSAEHFRDLIDSSVNQVEDGFEKTPVDGLRIASAGDSRRVMSLFQGLGTREPSWTFEHGERPGSLHLRPGNGADALGIGDLQGLEPAHGPAPLTLTRERHVGVGIDLPEWPLDVAGTARMSGRIGTTNDALPEVPADGEWHDITLPMTGCQAFEVMAGAGGERNKGRYALLHAVAMNAFHPRNSLLNWFFQRRAIRAQTAVYGSFADRLKLRWVSTSERHHYKLQLRSNADYGADRVVRYYLTQLWFDPFMQGSQARRDHDAGDEA